MDCPECHQATVKIVESQLCTNGTRRRRYRCLGCDYRWTIWDGERPQLGGSNPGGTRKGKLNPEAVHLALTRLDLSHKNAAELLGCSVENVRQIRSGKIYRSLWPELIRPNTPIGNGPSCVKCQEWRNGRCLFGFPDPLLEGMGFAVDCDVYKPVSQSMSLACPSSDQ